MAEFHQEHQQIFGQQQNAEEIHNTGQTLSFGHQIQSPIDLTALLTQLQAAITRETQTGQLSPVTGSTAHTLVVEATEQAKLPAPDKKGLLDHLTTVKTLLETAAAGSALVPAVIAAIDAVHKLF